MGEHRTLLARLFRVAVDAVAPEDLVARHLRLSGSRLVISDATGAEAGQATLPLVVLGAGKAAARMAKGCEAVAGSGVEGLVVVADGCEVPLERIECVSAGHPIPDRRGAGATEDLLRRAARVPAGATILTLISGGASSLLVKPAPPVTLPDQIAVTALLLACGAAIEEVNAVRKHLSLVKGGGLLRHCGCRVISLLLSDVIGDDPAVIGSGPAVPDPTTFADADAVLARYGLADRVPASVRARLDAGVRGEVPETLKPADPRAGQAINLVIGSNGIALGAAVEAASRAGWVIVRELEPIAGDTRSAARLFAANLRRAMEAAQRVGRRRCLLAGGETTVRVTGPGKGGRNQEFALALAAEIAGMPITVLSAGSDGIDGPTDVAGAFVDGTTLDRCRERGLDPDVFLARNDSYGFFASLGDHFRPGPTGTNVMDFKLALLEPAGMS